MNQQKEDMFASLAPCLSNNRRRKRERKKRRQEGKEAVKEILQFLEGYSKIYIFQEIGLCVHVYAYVRDNGKFG